MKPLSEVITIEAGKCGGRPCIRGMRITVYDVLSYLAAGMTHEQILADFPYRGLPKTGFPIGYRSPRQVAARSVAV